MNRTMNRAEQDMNRAFAHEPLFFLPTRLPPGIRGPLDGPVYAARGRGVATPTGRSVLRLGTLIAARCAPCRNPACRYPNDLNTACAERRTDFVTERG